MSKKVLILSGSPRKGGNSDLLCDEFMRGAQEAGNEVERFASCPRRLRPAPPAISAAVTTANAPIRTIWPRCCKR